ncbi:unnamed protein product [Ambrosiozyma monospora]|uniref:Unnamed protein product n=1 Tax=Ambrosiozyma monospora TaxID=43982 RepID=A0A9W7DMX7_AMBMO|nr:unnamed protein product [Ambrosiozyma monospora]
MSFGSAFLAAVDEIKNPFTSFVGHFKRPFINTNTETRSPSKPSLRPIATGFIPPAGRLRKQSNITTIARGFTSSPGRQNGLSGPVDYTVSKNISTVEATVTDIYKNRSTAEVAVTGIYKNRSPVEVAVTDIYKNRSTAEVAVTDIYKNRSTAEVAVTGIYKNRSTAEVAVTDIYKNRSTVEVAVSGIYENDNTHLGFDESNEDCSDLSICCQLKDLMRSTIISMKDSMFIQTMDSLSHSNNRSHFESGTLVEVEIHFEHRVAQRHCLGFILDFRVSCPRTL